MRKLNLKIWLKGSFIILFFIFLICIWIIPFGDIKILKNSYIRTRVLDKKIIREITSSRPRNWVALEEINPDAYRGIIISEDWQYFNHQGIDFVQLYDALYNSLIKNKRIRGASTITQQLVKNIFVGKERSLKRKFKEAIISLFLDFHLSKNKILELYFNTIEYGPNIYGIKNAARYYFDLSPIDLRAREGAFLAMLLPAPINRGESFRQKRLTVFASSMIKNILYKLKVAKIINRAHFNSELNRKFSWEL